jgi:hypothetical protein
MQPVDTSSVPFAELSDQGTYFIYHAHDLVPQDDRGPLQCKVSFGDVDVRPAYAAGQDFHPDLVVLWVRGGHLHKP